MLPHISFSIMCTGRNLTALQDEFEDSKEVIRISKSNKNGPQKEKVQRAKQRSTKHTHKTKDRVIQTPLKTGGELRWSGKVSSSCSTSGTRRFNLVTNPVTSHEWGKDREVFTTSGIYISVVICDTDIQ
jgi:hypothetical protein